MTPLLRKFFVGVPLLLAMPVLAGASSVWAENTELDIVDVRIGFGGSYKLGCWTPLQVDVAGGSEGCSGRVSITVPDSDGVPTTVSSPAKQLVQITPGELTTVQLLVRLGQSRSSLSVRFISEDGKQACRRTYQTSPAAEPGFLPAGLPAASRLMVEFGPSVGLSFLAEENSDNDGLTSTALAGVENSAELPTHWIGYEGVDTLLVSTSQLDLFQPLLENPSRVAALQEWVSLGGRLVVFCGENGDHLLKSGGALVSLVPGTYEKLEKLGQSQPLEIFSGAQQPITPNRRVNFPVPRLRDVRGKILISVGQGEELLPIAIRSQYGFGELVFVGLDVDRKPLRDWPGRESFLRKTMNWKRSDTEDQQSAQSFAEVPGDLSGHMRNWLDNKFADQHLVPFGIVALLVVSYLLLIGPGDYFLVKRILKRAQLTWVTFPLIVLIVSATAYWSAHWSKGDKLRLNQIEIVDVDTTKGWARGTIWTHFFAPEVHRYDLTLQSDENLSSSLKSYESVVSWLGLPGFQLGGMQASGTNTSIFDRGYRYGDQLQSMDGVPVEQWSTKTITARWKAALDSPVEHNLHRAREEMLQGDLTNSSRTRWEDCLLFYGRWAFRLGSVPEGATVQVDDSIQPRTVKTMLTSATAGDTTIANTTDDGTVPFRRATYDVARLVKVMMFSTEALVMTKLPVN